MLLHAEATVSVARELALKEASAVLQFRDPPLRVFQAITKTGNLRFRGVHLLPTCGIFGEDED